MAKRLAVFFLLLGVASIRAQERFPSGELEGFRKSATEGTIVHLQKPFVVRAVNGVIIRSVGDESPVEGALFELRGPGSSVIIRSATTRSDGKFSLSRVRHGKYVFKVTAPGFQSVVGIVLVSSRAAAGQIINLSMRPGV
jgi:hypothetical protein